MPEAAPTSSLPVTRRGATPPRAESAWQPTPRLAAQHGTRNCCLHAAQPPPLPLPPLPPVPPLLLHTPAPALLLVLLVLLVAPMYHGRGGDASAAPPTARLRQTARRPIRRCAARAERSRTRHGAAAADEAVPP